MAFRKTKRSIETLARMKAGKDAARINKPASNYPAALPALRREIIIIDHDFGEQINRLMFDHLQKLLAIQYARAGVVRVSVEKERKGEE